LSKFSSLSDIVNTLVIRYITLLMFEQYIYGREKIDLITPR